MCLQSQLECFCQDIKVRFSGNFFRSMVVLLACLQRSSYKKRFNVFLYDVGKSYYIVLLSILGDNFNFMSDIRKELEENQKAYAELRSKICSLIKEYMPRIEADACRADFVVTKDSSKVASDALRFHRLE